MASIFAKMSRLYNGKWSVTNREAISEDMLSDAKEAVVVDSDFGYSVKITRNDGQVGFIPVSNTSREVAEGEVVDLSKCFLLTLSRTGDADIYRVEVK